LQNHDQIGNRALGERLHHQIDLAAYRAATTVLLCAPATPLLFMGQEWAASTPFLYFTDHNEELGKLVTEGRRKEFRHFSAFADPAARERIPDPQAVSTFRASRLVWGERDQEPHASVFRFYQSLLQLRRTVPALRSTDREGMEVAAQRDDGILLKRSNPGGDLLLVAAALRGPGVVDCLEADGSLRTTASWEVVLTTEDLPFCSDPSPPRLDFSGAAPVIHFSRPGAVILLGRQGRGKLG
jgi:maltooligosyltrehalose trehalohydrolase